MAEQKVVSPEEKLVAAQKHVDELVQKGLVALDEFRGHVQMPSGWRRWKSVACCSRCAALSRRLSWK